MKKVIIAAIVALVIPACVFAGTRGAFDFTIGAAAQSTYSVQNVIEGELANFDAGKLSYGAAAEVKLTLLDANATALYNPDTKVVNGIMAADLALDILFVRVKAGVGYEYCFDSNSDTFVLGNSNRYVATFADFKEAAMDIHVGVDLLLGAVQVGLYATLPTETSIANGEWGKMFTDIQNHWANATIGATVGINLL